MTIAIQILMTIMIVLGLSIITITRNLIHAAYALALVLLGVAGIYVLLNAELLAVVQILLYAGGVVILLVFGVMMTNRLDGERVLTTTKNQVLGGVISLSLGASLIYLISTSEIHLNTEVIEQNQVEQIGLAFLTEHIVAFELIAFILLVVLVGAAYLSKMASND